MTRLAQAMRDQQGVVLPMTLLALLILSGLLTGFLELSSSEPAIAGNHLMVAQARALAEAGIEQAIWALNTSGIASPLVGTAPAPYDGSRFVATSTGGVQIGGFKVTVTAGAVAYERIITSTGWVPDDTTARGKARQKIVVTVSNPALIVKDPAAALAVRGDLHLGGTAIVDSRPHDGAPGGLPPDARFDTSCGSTRGTLATGSISLAGTAASVWGGTDGNDTPNEYTDTQPTGAIPPGAGDIVTHVAAQLFDQFVLSDADVNALRAYARTRGTYLQHAAGGKIAFDDSRRLPDGLVFIDTVSGATLTPATPASEAAAVEIHGQSVFRGTLFVNGSLTITGHFSARGMVYVQDRLDMDVSGGEVAGAVLSRNVRDASSTSIRSSAAAIGVSFHCNWAKTGGGTIASRWATKHGSYKEVSGS